MANRFWEAKLKDKDVDYEKLQNDEYKLLDFIRDKYDRKRYIPKGKDPMSLIYEGKEPEGETVEKKAAIDSEDSEK